MWNRQGGNRPFGHPVLFLVYNHLDAAMGWNFMGSLQIKPGITVFTQRPVRSSNRVEGPGTWARAWAWRRSLGRGFKAEALVPEA